MTIEKFKQYSIVLFVFMFLFFSPFIISLAVSKPIPPIDVIIEFAKQPAIPGIAVVNLKLIPLIKHSNIDVHIELSEKLRLINGVGKWNGILEADKTETFQYQIYIPDNKAYELKAVIILKMITGETVRREEVLEINPAVKKKKLKKNHTKEEKGRGVIEFKGE